MLNMSRFVVVSAILSVSASASLGQFGRPAGGQYTSVGMNPQRNSSIERDVWITPEAVASKEFRLQWTWKPKGAPHVPSSVGVTMQSGLFKPLSMVAFGPTYYATIDNETGVEYWTKRVSSPPAKACESVSAIARNSDANVPAPAPFRPNPIAGPFISAVGNPGEGAPGELMIGNGGPTEEYLKVAAEARAAGKPIPPPPPRAPRPAAALGDAPSAPIRFTVSQGFFAITPDGVLHNYGQNTGKDISQPKPFLPQGAGVVDLIVVNNVAYATVSGGCNGVEAGLYAEGTATAANAAALASFKPGAEFVGGPVFSSKGVMFTVLGKGAGQYADSVVAVDPKTLQVKESFKISGGPGTSALITKIGEKEVVVVGDEAGKIYLLDPAALGGTDGKNPLFVSEAGVDKGKATSQATLFSWKDGSGSTWIAEQTSGGTVAMKAEGSADHAALSAVWATKNIGSGPAPLVVGGVIFGSSPEKTKLVALDGASGKLLWSSEKTLTTPINSQPWYSLGQVYVSSSDANIYAFGMPMERY